MSLRERLKIDKSPQKLPTSRGQVERDELGNRRTIQRSRRKILMSHKPKKKNVSRMKAGKPGSNATEKPSKRRTRNCLFGILVK